ncbi:NUDIX domain-containing protein [Clostridium boliviensis]|uniref:NUDIX domain-containing protein n=1 Tax=Clostridium boliviensis TaxID=318465 RepID=A0ABU4GRC1_9CLOT|nr:NUDIX domain-containing protein [Clostridium boliviensis]MDW2798732.1 NUDIX domain-containing protein [Clostridium boliviensis]
MELWDIYDENRAATGRTHVRGIALGKGDYHLVADIWTVNQKNQILLTKRHPDKPYGLMWECSGGSVLAGESSAEGALRELFEEAGIHADKEDLKLIHSIRQKERFVDTYITRQNITIEDVKLQKEEVVDARLVTFNELLDLWKQGVVVPKSRFLLYKDSIKEFINPPS